MGMIDKLCRNPVNHFFPRGKHAVEILEQPKVENRFSLEGHPSFIFRKNHSSCFMFKQTYVPFSSIGKPLKPAAKQMPLRLSSEQDFSDSEATIVVFRVIPGLTSCLLAQRKQSLPSPGPPVDRSISILFINAL